MPTLRKPRPEEMDRLFMMGFDVWGDGDTEAEHLHACRTSIKYQSGEWYVWDVDGQPVASLLLLSSGYHLPSKTVGLAAIATDPEYRQRGYASALIEAVLAQLSQAQGVSAVFLHSDIDLNFYRRLGFATAAPNSHCMIRTLAADVRFERLPDYF